MRFRAKSNSSRELVQRDGWHVKALLQKPLHALQLHPRLLHAPQNTVAKGRQQGVSKDAIADLGDRRTSRAPAGGQQPELRGTAGKGRGERGCCRLKAARRNGRGELCRALVPL